MPTDTWIQSLVQALSGGGYMVALIFFGMFAGTCLAALATLALYARQLRHSRQRLQRELAKSMNNARR